MKNISLVCLLLITGLYASNEHNKTGDNLAKKHIEEQIKREQKYHKEQRFYQGDEYNLKEVEVDPDSVKKVPSLEPDYDFDMSEGVYSD
jgi:hypothetical protein